MPGLILEFRVKHNAKMMNLDECEDVHGWLDREAYIQERELRRHGQSESEV
jgi:Cu/Ag efflux protein CusF